MNVKVELDDRLIEAIEHARTFERDGIPPRTEMIRRLLAIGLAENLKRRAERAEK